MNPIIIYLLKVSLGIALVTLPYYFFLRKDPNLGLKRAYLLSGLAASWISPFLTVRRPEALVEVSPVFFPEPVAANALADTLPLSVVESSAGINWMGLLLLFYLLGALFLLLKNLVIISRWNLIWKQNRDESGIAYTGSRQVFTLFTRIFIPLELKENQDIQSIILHERAHVAQLHFLDLVLVELSLLLTWFNPFTWLLSRMVKENHEHLADRQVLATGVNPALYRAQLLNHTLGVNVFRLGNQFAHSLTLNRFKMMKKPRRSFLGIAKLSFLAPVLLLTLALTTGMSKAPLIDQGPKSIKGKVIFAESGKPATGTSVVVAGGTNGCVVDRDGTFSLEVEGDPDLVFSFVGYASLKVKASEIGTKPLELKSEASYVDLESTPNIGLHYSASDGFTYHEADDGKKPVLIMDGEVVINLEGQDPNSIKSITVIKDPEHELARKYDAENGLIIITTQETIISKDKDTKLIKDGQEAKSDAEKEIFFIVEDMPQFPGGRIALKSYIYDRLEYPAKAKKKKIEGEVIVQILVDVKGKVINPKVVKSSNKGFDKAALDVFNDMPDWKPGKQRGKAVEVRLNIPVEFSLEQK